MADWQPSWLTWVTPYCFMYFMLSWSDQCHFIGPALHNFLNTHKGPLTAQLALHLQPWLMISDLQLVNSFCNSTHGGREEKEGWTDYPRCSYHKTLTLVTMQTHCWKRIWSQVCLALKCKMTLPHNEAIMLSSLKKDHNSLFIHKEYLDFFQLGRLKINQI